MAHPLVDLLVGLIPQKDDDVNAMFRWRWCSVVMGVGTLVLVIYMLGWIPGVDSPVAMAKDVQTSKISFQGDLASTNAKVDKLSNQVTDAVGQLKDGQVRSLSTDLIEATRYKCRADKAPGDTSLPFWTARLQSLKIAYQNLVLAPWPDVPCSSF
jgi:hypothetical protein